MANKYQTINPSTGRDTLVEGLVTSSGAGDAGKIPALDSDGRFNASLMPAGVTADVKILEATEALSAGDYVNIYNASGTAKCRKADASNDRPAHGFVKASVLSGANAEIYFEGPNSGLSGIVGGTRYYLGASGAFTATVPATPSSLIHQFLGVGVDATTINTDIEDAVIL